MKKNIPYEFKWPMLGNENALTFLQRSLENREVASVYMFVGPDDVGKTTLAESFAASLLCQNYGQGGALPCGLCQACLQNKISSSFSSESGFASVHPDFHLLKRLPDKKNISIDQVREFIQSLEMSSFHNSFRLGVIKQAERLSTGAANALLKTLEEPRKDVVIILIVKDVESLPQTISSRAQVVRFYPVKTEEIYHYLINQYGASRSQALHLSRAALGRPALAVKFLENNSFFEEYIGRLDKFLKFSNQSLAERFAVIDELLGEKATGQDASRRAVRIIDSWQGLVRDLLLAYHGHYDLVQHEVMIEKIKEMSRGVLPEKLIAWLSRFNEAKLYLAYNVSAKNVLEQLVIAI